MANLIVEATDRLRDITPQLAEILPGCLTNAWLTTVRTSGPDVGFVPTGDIPAMWHRDTVGQLRPYLGLVADDSHVADVLAAAVRRMTAAIRHDPYANAFNAADNGARVEHDDHPAPSGRVWERKYELDSLAAFIMFAYELWRAGGGSAHLDGDFDAAVGEILELWRLEQQHELSTYRFERRGGEFASDTLPHGGRGARVGWTGMTWSGFRPSDDRCTFGYLVPANVAAVMALRCVRDLANHALVQAGHGTSAAALEGQISLGVQKFGVVSTDDGPMYAYEVDGLGAALLMDDANPPSLLSLPYLGWCSANDPIYLRTRLFILSHCNPFFCTGSAARGIGSPHTPRGWVWPIAVSMQALTSTSKEDKRTLLVTLAGSTAGRGLMHESFDVNDPSRFTRPWFAWANSLFAEALLDLAGVPVARCFPPTFSDEPASIDIATTQP